MAMAFVTKGHFDTMDEECIHDLRLVPRDVRHIEDDFTAEQRDEMRASGARAMFAGPPQFEQVGLTFRATADPFRLELAT